MTFTQLSQTLRGWILLWVALTEFLLFYNFFCYVTIGKGKTRTRCVILTLINFALFQVLCQHSNGDFLVPVRLPLWLLLPVILLMSFFAIAEQYRIEKWSRSHISAQSIKEAMDMLPTGLCHALPEGLPLLVNEKMDEVSLLIFGHVLLDARETWNALREGRAKGLVRGGEEPIYELPDGRIYSFRRDLIDLEVGRTYLIQATDVSKEYAMTRELEEKQKKARIINTRLKTLLGTIEYVTMSRELLQMKVALHDNLGRLLLSAKRYVLNSDSVDPRLLFSLWRQNLQNLIGEAPEHWQVPYYVAKKEAATLGIELQIVGTLPEEENLLPVIDQAISTHVINVLRHADGHLAMVHICEYEKEWQITFRNDGKPPDHEITETGGLMNLRRLVEAVHGSMRLSSSPRFEMELTLPKKGTDNTWS